MTDARLALIALSLEVGVLRDLAPWEPIGASLEALAGAMRDRDSLSPAQVAGLRRWAGRWREVHPDLRRFYAAQVAGPEPGVAETALWWILEGDAGRPTLSGRQRGALRAAWNAWTPEAPPGTLLPRARRSARRYRS